MDKAFVYLSSMAQGEPGKAAIGIAITNPQGGVVEKSSKLIGRSTSQVSKYKALIEGCKKTSAYSPKSVLFFIDDQLAANQLNGIVETREPHLNHLIAQAKRELNRFPRWRVNYIEPDTNRLARRLVNQALHKPMRKQVNHKRLELQLISLIATFNEKQMKQLINYAKQLQEEG